MGTIVDLVVIALDAATRELHTIGKCNILDVFILASDKGSSCIRPMVHENLRIDPESWNSGLVGFKIKISGFNRDV